MKKMVSDVQDVLMVAVKKLRANEVPSDSMPSLRKYISNIANNLKKIPLLYESIFDLTEDEIKLQGDIRHTIWECEDIINFIEKKVNR